jgi:hypothetical protein
VDRNRFYIAERTLYLPSAGLMLAAAAALARLPSQALRPLVAVLVLLGGIRTFLRVPVWRDEAAVTISITRDSPHSYLGHSRMAGVYLDRREPAKALTESRIAAGIYRRDPWIYVTGAVAAFSVREPRTADSLLAALERVCAGGCAATYYRYEAAVARSHGYPEAADSLLARLERLRAP